MKLWLRIAWILLVLALPILLWRAGYLHATLAVILPVMAAWLEYSLDRERKGRKSQLRLLFVLLLVVVAATEIMRVREQTRLERQVLQLQDKSDTLIARNDTLVTKVEAIQGALRPFERVARTWYPNLDAIDALARLASDLSAGMARVEGTVGRLIPRLEFVPEVTYHAKETAASLFVTRWYFRSVPSVPLRDVSVVLRFDRHVLGAAGRITGSGGAGAAVVVDDGSWTGIHRDSLGVSFRTNSLRPDNDIEVQVRSRAPLNIVTMTLEPAPK